MKPLLKAMIDHGLRLDILVCLVAEGPLSIEQLATRTGKPPSAISYHLEVLRDCDLVDKSQEAESQSAGAMTVARYEATFRDHPGWVHETVIKRVRQLDEAKTGGRAPDSR